MDDDLIRKNPFQFELATVIINDSIRREALSRDQESQFDKYKKINQITAKCGGENIPCRSASIVCQRRDMYE